MEVIGEAWENSDQPDSTRLYEMAKARGYRGSYDDLLADRTRWASSRSSTSPTSRPPRPPNGR
jgi:hypothetical protein